MTKELTILLELAEDEKLVKIAEEFCLKNPSFFNETLENILIKFSSDNFLTMPHRDVLIRLIKKYKMVKK